MLADRLSWDAGTLAFPLCQQGSMLFASCVNWRSDALRSSSARPWRRYRFTVSAGQLGGEVVLVQFGHSARDPVWLLLCVLRRLVACQLGIFPGVACSVASSGPTDRHLAGRCGSSGSSGIYSLTLLRVAVIISVPSRAELRLYALCLSRCRTSLSGL